MVMKRKTGFIITSNVVGKTGRFKFGRVFKTRALANAAIRSYYKKIKQIHSDHSVKSRKKLIKYTNLRVASASNV